MISRASILQLWIVWPVTTGKIGKGKMLLGQSVRVERLRRLKFVYKARVQRQGWKVNDGKTLWVLFMRVWSEDMDEHLWGKWILFWPARWPEV